MEMDAHRKTITSTCSAVLKNIRQFQLLEPSVEHVKQGDGIIAEGVQILNLLKQYVQSLETELTYCQEHIDEANDELTYEEPNDDFVFNTNNGLLSFRGRPFMNSL